MSRHDALKATYVPGQRWETMVVEKVPEDQRQWVGIAHCDPHNGQPLWDERQEYRLAPSQPEVGTAI